ncbi:hypothetical protein BDV12DRAFT_204084 [Aspergillus spectabilis]
MCALAAPFYYSSSVASTADTTARFFDAGKLWAERAAQSFFSNFGHLSIDSLMTGIVLHEYYLRTGECPKAFLISGVIVRHIQILSAVKESRRRLLWAAYLLDKFIECGIDQLCLVSADDIQVQLPCLEELFIRNIPCVTEMLSGQILPFVDQPSDTEAACNLDTPPMPREYIKVDLYYESAHQALERLEMFSPRVPLRAIEAQSEAAIFTPPQFSLEYILNPLGAYPMARKKVGKRHEPHVTGLVVTRPEETPLLTGDEVILSHLLDWEQDTAIMNGIGYPLFLSPLGNEDERAWTSLQRD